MITVDDVISRLQTRADNHGMEVGDLLEKIPANVVDSHTEVNTWLNEKDISHINPVSTHPELQDDPGNWVWEDSDVNRARGAEVMTEVEVLTAELDNQIDATRIDGPSPDVPATEWMDVLEDNDIEIDLDDVDVSFPETFPWF